MLAGQPGYRPALDSDNDGVGCEESTPTVTAAATTGSGKLAYTGVALEPLLVGAVVLLASGALLTIAGRRAP